jgi:hypothetical protein
MIFNHKNENEIFEKIIFFEITTLQFSKISKTTY